MSAQSSGSRYWVSGYPELVEQWHPERNGVLTPETLSAGSGRPVWWRCARGPDHVWRATPNNRTHGAGCPYCANRKVSSSNNLAACFPWIAAEWHPTNNGKTTPREILAGSSRVCWWRCSVRPDHEWRTSVRDRTRRQTTCPFCVHKRLSEDASLAQRQPALVREWDSALNGSLLPHAVSPSSARVVWWRCRTDPAHTWQARVSNRVLRASGCPYCAHRRRATSKTRGTSP